jgi:hydroxyethylthiazole kinase-like uncharacterized protein yjeF
MPMPMPVLSADRRWPLHDAAATRRIEQAVQQSLPAHALIERAGFAVARLALAVAPHARHIWVAAGGGNNGGDALIAARHLAQAGKAVHVTLFGGDPARLPPDAMHALATAQSAGLSFDDDVGRDANAHLVIDGLLGIGGREAPRPPMAAAVARINRLSCPVLAIDLPSALPADTGSAATHVVVLATHTLSLLTLKPGLFTADGRDHAGRVWFDALGVPDDDLAASATAWLGGPPQPTVRHHAQHKGSFGDVVVLGGAEGMAGAPLLAARAALAAGAGRVHLARLDQRSPPADPVWPELMLRTPEQAMRPERLARATLVCGCGGGQAIVTWLLAAFEHAARLVLDADALNAVAADRDLLAALARRAERHLGTVLTPHPLEAARLLGVTTAQLQADRLHAARRLADLTQATVVLKGSGSVIVQPGCAPMINPTGNARLATAGSGDVLAGWIAGLWAAEAEWSAFDAAAAAAWLHGRAAEVTGDSGPLTASALIGRIGRPMSAS